MTVSGDEVVRVVEDIKYFGTFLQMKEKRGGIAEDCET